MNTIDKILLSLVGFLIGFTVTMIVLFCIYQQVPDTLVECFFGVCGSELVITFAIWWVKKKYSKGGKTNDRKTEK